MKKNRNNHNVIHEVHEDVLAPRFVSAESVNGDASSRQLLKALTALKKGDFSARLPLDWNGRQDCRCFQ